MFWDKGKEQSEQNFVNFDIPTLQGNAAGDNAWVFFLQMQAVIDTVLWIQLILFNNFFWHKVTELVFIYLSLPVIEPQLRICLLFTCYVILISARNCRSKTTLILHSFKRQNLHNLSHSIVYVVDQSLLIKAILLVLASGFSYSTCNLDFTSKLLITRLKIKLNIHRQLKFWHRKILVHVNQNSHQIFYKTYMFLFSLH